MARKKKEMVFKVVLSVLLLFISMVYVIYLFVIRPKVNTKSTNQYQPYSIRGIDVSHYQSDVDWPMINRLNTGSSKIDFVYIKATEGSDWQDEFFMKNWVQLRQSGIVRGAYHYYKPRSSARKQLDNFLSLIHLLPGDLPPVLDIEEKGRLTVQQLRDSLATWLNGVEQTTGMIPVIYTSPSFYRDYLSPGFEKYPIWVAHYHNDMQPQLQQEWLFWQQTKKGKVKGIPGNVDMNVFNGDKEKFERILHP